MSFNLRKSGAWVGAGAVKLRKSGAWATAGFVKVMKSGVWVTVWPLVAITNQSISRVASTATQATYTLNTSGIVQKTEGASTTTLETWLLNGAAGDYEARATISSGDSPTGSALSTWLALSSTRAWTLQDAVVDGIPLTCVLLVEIRDVATNTVQTSASITITSERV